MNNKRALPVKIDSFATAKEKVILWSMPSGCLLLNIHDNAYHIKESFSTRLPGVDEVSIANKFEQLKNGGGYEQ